MSAPPATAAPAAVPWWRQVADSPRWRGVAGALGLYALTRLAQLLTLAWLTPPDGPGVREHLLIWDAGWFVDIATEGYPHGYTYDDAGTMLGNGYAFLPVYPLLIRAGAVTGIDPDTVALAVSWLAGAAAAVLVLQLGTALYDRRVGHALVVLVCAQPMSAALSMGYTEALFLALAAGTLLAAYRRTWLAAGVLGLAAGLTRPSGVAVAAALALAVAMRWRSAPAPERWRAVAAAGAALAAFPGYLLWVAYQVGDLDAWFRIQAAGWGSTFDFGAATASFVRDTLRGDDGWVAVSVAWLLIAAVVAAVAAVGVRAWPPLAVYGLVSLVLVVGQAGYWHSKPRLLVPVLWILLPAALAAARARPYFATVALAGYAAFGIWYGAYLIVVWPYTI